MSNCNKCRPKSCGCEEASICGCDIKLDLLCAFYSGVDLQPLGITSGMDGNTVIKIINDYLQELDLDPTVIQSVGNGAKVYKGLSSEYRHEIKSILQGEGVIITEQDNTITISFDSSLIPTSTTLENLGTGITLSTEIEAGKEYGIKSLISTDSTISIIDNGTSIDLKSNVPESPIQNIGSDGTGNIEIYNGIIGNRVGISTIRTSNLSINKDVDGTININYPESGSSSSNSYFVDETYVPTPTSQPDGSRARPFTTLTNAVNARIGTGTRLNPNGSKGAITLLSDVRDSIDPTINGTIFRIEGGKKYVYTGTNTYMFDLGALFDQAKIPSGPLSQEISYTIQGEGTITRSTGFGHVQVKNDDTYPGASGLDPISILNIRGESNGLNFVENEATGYVHLTNKEGELLYNGGGTAVFGSNIVPSIPMFNIVGASKRYWSVDISGTQVKIDVFSQVAIRASLKGSIYEHTTSAFIVDQSSTFVGYQTRDVSGVFVVYTPYSSKNLIESLDGSSIQLDNFGFAPDSPNFTKSNSIFKLTNGSRISVLQRFLPITNKGAINFIEYSGSGNIAFFNNSEVLSFYTNLIKGDNINSIEFVFKNSNGNNITTAYNQATPLPFTTGGTLSSIGNKYYLTGIPVYADNTTAKPILGNDALYRTADGTLKVTY